MPVVSGLLAGEKVGADLVAAVGLFKPKDQRTVRDLEFHLKWLCPDLGKPRTAFKCGEPDLFIIVAIQVPFKRAEQYRGMLCAEKVPHLFTGHRFEIRRGAVGLKSSPMVQ